MYWLASNIINVTARTCWRLICPDHRQQLQHFALLAREHHVHEDTLTAGDDALTCCLRDLNCHTGETDTCQSITKYTTNDQFYDKLVLAIVTIIQVLTDTQLIRIALVQIRNSHFASSVSSSICSSWLAAFFSFRLMAISCWRRHFERLAIGQPDALKQ